MPTILIVEDERTMQRLLTLHLTKEGFETITADHGEEAISLLSSHQIDLAVVDVMMPVMDGFDFVKKLRETSTLPVIFLTARSDEKDRIEGLMLGGDDYLSKPFSKGELIARIQAVLRRTYQRNRNIIGHIDEREILSLEGIQLNRKARSVKVDQIPISLTVKEFDLLLFLFEHQGQVFTREHLLTSVWGLDYEGTERTVDTHIKTLRMKLKPYGNVIQTVWGIGYKLVDIE
ncbi:two component transcriptional regulator, winged helix family protein [Alkalihalophilus pseudofirmus OF4]|uniref:Two component transcriptional regulator, winged helix family protein n=1 Tax=Alkalihalophilus pseudofirmus (strain ATCC BAA-2126 / JCM 17055 / OF4) TaxID=398511 RepID=D3FYN8_ALKPO|nr:two component transcriptional regulator, winged helix family protein [Alkalihalophilus pseudofirmus OF4]